MDAGPALDLDTIARTSVPKVVVVIRDDRQEKNYFQMLWNAYYLNFLVDAYENEQNRIFSEIVPRGMAPLAEVQAKEYARFRKEGIRCLGHEHFRTIIQPDGSANYIPLKTQRQPGPENFYG